MHSSIAVLTTITGPKARQIYKQMTGREPDCTRMGSSKAVLTTITGPKARDIYDEMTRPHHFSDKEFGKEIMMPFRSRHFWWIFFTKWIWKK